MMDIYRLYVDWEKGTYTSEVFLSNVRENFVSISRLNLNTSDDIVYVADDNLDNIISIITGEEGHE